MMAGSSSSSRCGLVYRYPQGSLSTISTSSTTGSNIRIHVTMMRHAYSVGGGGAKQSGSTSLLPAALTIARYGSPSPSLLISFLPRGNGKSLDKDNNKLILKASETETSTPSSNSSSQSSREGEMGKQQQLQPDEVKNKEEQEEEKEEEYYEVEIEQPYGLRFTKGRDGATYIDAIAPGLSADKTGKFSVGDKVIATSAVFGPEVWPAAEYGRTMYTIRQRIGPLYMKVQKRFGKIDDGGDLTEKEIIRAERNSGFISNRVREIQLQNYQRKMEEKERREKDLREGLLLYKNGKYEEAREKFESVLGSRPTPEEASVASYNVACCYSKLDQIQAGLSALEDALKDGYEDFKRIRTDPDLANLRTSDEFEKLLKRFDESFINENAINALKSLFGFNKR